jgi:hypothetical protein
MHDMSVLDEQMQEVADFFTGRIKGEHEILCPEALNRKALEFSLESLRVVDSWLERLYQEGADPGSQEAAESIVWSGAYVGEVIRRNATRRYRWMRYQEYMASQPEGPRKMIPYTFGTQFILTADGSGMTLPINKVCRWLAEGPENNLQYYASAECGRE